MASCGKVYKIAVIPGDGIGPEVVREGLKVLEAAASAAGMKYEIACYDFGGERYLRTGEALPESAIDELRTFDAIYFGAIGHPDVPPGVLERGLLLRIRFELDLYINLRPVKLYPGVWTPLKDKHPEDIDFVVVRENTEDVYVGIGGWLKRGTQDEVAFQVAVYTRHGTERCIKYAFELARLRNKKRRVTLVDKSNVLTYGHELWRRTFEEVAKDYPDIEADHAYVDACCMWMVKNPEWFDVIVTTNMFGDIITDLGAIIQGGMGVAASGNIHPGRTSMFEPIHGSAPKYAGKNVANPIAAILAMQMLVDFLGEHETAKRIEQACIRALGSGKIKSMEAGRMGMSTSEVGDFIASLASE
ncbi:MAG: 3-isopropylmalate dehydrogenase [Armatimonadota bacterium]|nr:3-isopropylmalate dehydrogenase [Armatimonadota bacterium]MCX7776853.1 3-isopropylmalate dehydrogenase [Armatimonadota bacterium]MDW8024461.1 3-isopropylmalate dehydrogenase [Armatimonadota bacterium]